MTQRNRIEDVLRYLGVDDAEFLPRMRSEGLFETDELAADEAEELRVAALLVRELDVNAAGVEVILHMRRRLVALEHRSAEAMRLLLEQLDER